MTIEEAPDVLSLPVAVIGGGMLAAFAAVLITFPFIDRFLRDRWRLSRGQAMSLLLAVAFVAWGIGSALTYALLHDDPRYHPPEAISDDRT
jgi:uncharacterized membrane protein YedE/YeeE